MQVVHVMLNKPRGLVTTLSDEQGRDTVYRCFDGADLGFIAPVGRLDKASEGLLLFTNDPQWAAAVSYTHLDVYKRQVYQYLTSNGVDGGRLAGPVGYGESRPLEQTAQTLPGCKSETNRRTELNAQ